MAAVLDHVTVTASDLAASLAFYDAALGALGMQRNHEFGDEEEDDAAVEVAAYGADGVAAVWVVTGAEPTRGAHLAFRASGPDVVERFHAAAVAAGGTSRARPRRPSIHHRGDVTALVADPDGNLVEAVAAG